MTPLPRKNASGLFQENMSFSQSGKLTIAHSGEYFLSSFDLSCADTFDDVQEPETYTDDNLKGELLTLALL